MKKILTALAAVVGLLLAFPSYAHAAPQVQIGVTEVAGGGGWPELRTVVDTLRTTYSIPITANGCVAGQPCIYVWYYNRKDGLGGLAAPRPGEPLGVNVALNHAYDRGGAYRQMLIFHELGHALGLGEHDPTCRSSMAPSITMCGYYVLGYTAAEQAKLRATWG